MYRVQQFLTVSAGPRVNVVREFYRKFLHLARNTKERRGLRLMQEWLSPAQRQQFERFGYFDVIGCTSGTVYRIYHSVTAPNVYKINEVGRRKKAVCFAPIGALAKGDVMLTQKIALETDEQSVLEVANIFAA
jgi:hypothetical protein